MALSWAKRKGRETLGPGLLRVQRFHFVIWLHDTCFLFPVFHILYISTFLCFSRLSTFYYLSYVLHAVYASF
jgi:hypothetical protein